MQPKGDSSVSCRCDGYADY